MKSHISSRTAWLATNILIALAILSEATATRYVVDQEELIPYWKSEKGDISQYDQQACHLQLFQIFYYTRENT